MEFAQVSWYCRARTGGCVYVPIILFFLCFLDDSVRDSWRSTAGDANKQHGGENISRLLGYALGQSWIPPVYLVRQTRQSGRKGLGATITGASLMTAIPKYLDERATVSCQDMYFLLQAETHLH